MSSRTPREMMPCRAPSRPQCAVPVIVTESAGEPLQLAVVGDMAERVNVRLGFTVALNADEVARDAHPASWRVVQARQSDQVMQRRVGVVSGGLDGKRATAGHCDARADQRGAPISCSGPTRFSAPLVSVSPHRPQFGQRLTRLSNSAQPRDRRGQSCRVAVLPRRGPCVLVSLGVPVTRGSPGRRRRPGSRPR